MPAKPRKLRPYRFRKQFYLNPSPEGPKLDYPLEMTINRIDYTSKDSYRAVFDSNGAIENSYSYEDLTDISDYVIQDGDYLEYDIKQTKKDSCVGFNYECNDGISKLRKSGLVDQYNLSMDLDTDISDRAFNRWYHRKAAIPTTHVGKTIHRFEVGFDKSYENVRAVGLSTTLMWSGICVTPDGDVYACANNNYIYKRKAGSSEFKIVFQTTTTTTKLWKGICSTSDGNVYAIVDAGKVWKLNKTTGNFEEQASVTSRAWTAITFDGGNLYASVSPGLLYTRLASDTGDFTPIAGASSRAWTGVCGLGSAVYGCVWGGEIYKIESGVETSCGAGSRNWGDINTNGTYVYAVAQGPGDTYVKDRTGATDSFTALGLITNDWGCIAVDSNENIYSGVSGVGGDIYFKPCEYSKTNLIPDSPDLNYLTGDSSDSLWGSSSDFSIDESDSKIYKQTEYGFEIFDTHSSKAFKGFGYLGLHLDSVSTPGRFLYFCEDQNGICHKVNGEYEVLSKTDEYKSRWWDVWVTSSGAVYATVVPRNEDGTYADYFVVYKKNAGSTTWASVGQVTRPAPSTVQEPSGICVNPINNDVYVFDKKYGRLYRQLLGVGLFTLVAGDWSGLETTAGSLFSDQNGNIYLCTDTDVYRRDQGTGLWTAQGLSIYGFKDIWISPNTGIIYGASSSGIYEITVATTTTYEPLGTGSFNDFATWADMTVDSEGSVYVAIINGGVYKQYRGQGNFVALDTTSRNWKRLACGTVGGTEYVYGIIDGSASCLFRVAVGSSTFVLAANQPVSATNIWKGLAINSSGYIYANDSANKIFRSTGGAFSLFYTAPGATVDLCITPNDHIYSCQLKNIYICTDGITFTHLESVGTANVGIVSDSTGNVYIYDNTGTTGRTIFRKGIDEDSFTSIGNSFMLWNRLVIDSNDNVYGIATRGNVFKFKKWNTDRYHIGFIKNIYITDGAGTTRKEILVGTESSTTTFNTRHSGTFNPSFADFETLSITAPTATGGYGDIYEHPNGNIYASKALTSAAGGSLWIQNEGQGSFTQIPFSATPVGSLNPTGVFSSPYTGYLYLSCWYCTSDSDGRSGIWVNFDPINSPGEFIRLSDFPPAAEYHCNGGVFSLVTGNSFITGKAVAGSSDRYVAKQIGELGLNGSFTRMSNDISSLDDIVVNYDGYIFTNRYGGPIYYKTQEFSSTGVLTSNGQSKDWSGVCVAPNGDLFACVQNDYVWTLRREATSYTLVKITAGISDLAYGSIYITENWKMYLSDASSLYRATILTDNDSELHSFTMYPPVEEEGVINVDENHVNANFSDIRFSEVDGVSIMDHFVETYDEVLKYGKVLVKFSYIFANMGTTTYDGAYTIRTFSTSGDGVFATVKDGTIDCLLVGGGGGSGGWCTGGVGDKRYEGGGGGGEVLEYTSVTLSKDRYVFHVGAGGIHVDSQHEPGDHIAIGSNDGVDTTFNGETARGGHGGYYDDTIVKHDHGGNSGSGQLGSIASYGSGGGGAGGPGSGGTEHGHSGDGGVGVASSITGAPVYYGGGGAGGHWIALGTHGLGTIGGGGTGLFNPHPELDYPTTTWTPPHLPGNDGADGILIIKYLTADQLETDETYPSFFLYYSWPGPVGPPKEGTTDYWTDPGTGIEYTIRTFTSDAHFYPCRSGQIDYLIVGGGGGAGGYCNATHGQEKYHAGGGGGEVIEVLSGGIEPGTYNIIVGQGGAHSDADHTSGQDGTYSSFLGDTANGGGRGISSYTEDHGGINENVPYSHDRGGSSGDDIHFGWGAPGHPDFAALPKNDPSSRAYGAGGAGAGEHGSRGIENVKGGKGGDGIVSSITGTATFYGGGGGGGNWGGDRPEPVYGRGENGRGTIGQGGRGMYNPKRVNTPPGAPPFIAGQDGSDGIVIIRYQTSLRLEEYREDPSDPDAVFDEGLRYWYFSSTTGTPTPVVDPVTSAAAYKGTDIDAAVINHSWTSPDPIVINGNSWENQNPAQVIWYGWVLTPLPGTYIFYVSGDDGYYLWLNDDLVISRWTEQAETERSYTLDVEASSVPIKIQWFGNNTGPEVIRLYWSPADGSGKALVPLSNLRCTTSYSTDPPTFRRVCREEILISKFTIPI